MKQPLSLVLVALLAVLAACQPIEEDEDEDNLDPQLQGCLPIEGEVDFTEPDAIACEGCEILDPEDAADGNPASFATIRMPVDEGGTARIRVANADGSFVSGRLFGVLQSIEYGDSDDASIVIRTFASPSTTAVDEKTLSLGEVVGGDQDSPTRFSFQSTGAFDTVELEFSRTDGVTSSGSVTARIHEFCSNAQPVD